MVWSGPGVARPLLNVNNASVGDELCGAKMYAGSMVALLPSTRERGVSTPLEA